MYAHLSFGRAVAALVFAAVVVVAVSVFRPAIAAPAAALDPRALELLKSMSTRLAAAQSLSFRTRSSGDQAGVTGQFLAVFADAEVAAMRPDKVKARAKGASPPFDFFFDGKTLTLYQPTLNVYAREEASKTLDTLLPYALEHAGILLPFADLLYSDPYAAMTKGITRARYGGVATIAGQRCDHASFAGPGAEWGIWIDARTALPCRLTGTLLDLQGSPRFAVDFSEWKLNPPLSAASFTFVKPAGAAELDFRTLIGR
jgi:hypothetical protein